MPPGDFPDDRLTDGPFMGAAFLPSVFAGSDNFWLTARPPEDGVWGEPAPTPGDEGFYIPQ